MQLNYIANYTSYKQANQFDIHNEKSFYVSHVSVCCIAT